MELWGNSLPDGDNPLQIPTGTFDWLKGHTEGGPTVLFTASISSLLKPGDKLYGSASINCPTCVRRRSYLVYIEWGKGGWMAETNDPKGMLIIPAKNTPEGRMGYFHQISAIPDGAKPNTPPGLAFILGEDCWRLKKGETVPVDIEASEPGTYSFLCCKSCGTGHKRMTGRI